MAAGFSPWTSPPFLCTHASADPLCEITVRLINMWIGNGSLFRPFVFGHMCAVLRQGYLIFTSLNGANSQVRFDNLCSGCWYGIVRTLVSRRGYKFYARNLDCLACFPAPTTPAIDSRFPPPSSSYRRRDGGDDGGAVTASGACCSPIPGTP